MATGDRERGVEYLRLYHSVSGLGLVGVTADELVAYYDGVAGPTALNPAGFVGAFGGAVRVALGSLDRDELLEAFREIANRSMGQIPDYRDFIPALTAQISGLSNQLRLVGVSALEGAKQAVGVVAGAAGLYALGAGAVAAFVLLGRRK